jgi:hypothetical protein
MRKKELNNNILPIMPDVVGANPCVRPVPTRCTKNGELIFWKVPTRIRAGQGSDDLEKIWRVNDV